MSPLAASPGVGAPPIVCVASPETPKTSTSIRTGLQLYLSSPVTLRAGLPSPDAARLERLGGALEALIRASDPTATTADVTRRVYQYYLPVYFWACGLVAVHQAQSARPLVLGFSCPQGGGKTTMVSFLRELFALDCTKCAGASLDDFYVPFTEQNRIAARHWDNRLLHFRGSPGTHDIPLLCRTLDRLRLMNGPCAPPHVEIIRYDKTQNGGRGDRAPPERSDILPNGVQVFLLEGWCLGFQAQGKEGSFVSKDMRVVDEYLAEFDAVYSRLDGLLVVEVDDLNCVFEWRAQPERESIAAGKTGMSPDQVRDFVSRFMPSYEQYTPRLYDPDYELLPGRELHIKINATRQPV
jgi:D-glycerate 3-kinase